MPIRWITFLCLFSLAGLSTADESRFLSRTRRLTFDGRRAGEGYFHPSGEKLIFQSEREPGNPFYQIYVLDLTTGDTNRVSPGMGKTTCAFFRPGSSSVLFASTHLDPRSLEHQKSELEMRASGRERRYSWDYDLHYDIFEAGRDGSSIRRLTDAVGYDAEGSYSPDGSKIVFTSIRDAYPLEKLSVQERKLAEIDTAFFAEIYIMDADGGNQTRLTSTPGYDGGPFFMPGGERIVWRRFEENGMLADVYTMKLDGTGVRRLTDFDAMSWAPYFHPSGDYAIFASNKLGFENFELFLVDAEGAREPVRISFTAGFDGLAVFSPDGSQLCWTSTRHGGGRESGQLYLGRWNDAEARKALADAPLRGRPNTVLSAKSHPFPNHTYEAAITEADLTAQLEFLAAPELEGRLTGTAGEKTAADFIEQRFKQIGLKPLEGAHSLKHEFEFTAGYRSGDRNALGVKRIDANPHVTLEERAAAGESLYSLAPGVDFNPMSISSEGSTSGELVFAGYGLVVPGEDGASAYDSYGELDVEGRIVLMLRYVPEDVQTETRLLYNRYAQFRYKAMQARERGAVGMLVVTGPNSPGAGTLLELGMDIGGASSEIFAASITVDAADRLLASSGKTLAELQTELDQGEPMEGTILRDTLVELEIDLIKETRVGRNVIGILPPAGGVTPETEFVAIGAHFDHLGRGGGNSLARKDEKGEVHPGADDNASGVAAVLEVAEHMAASGRERRRAVLFAAWSGEELGLLGSSNFTKVPPFELSRLAGYLNLDMVGRVAKNKLAIQGVGSSPDWRGLIERKNVMAGFDLKLTEDPYLPTDSMAFYLKEVPGLHFFTGAHEDYHRPTDTADKINYEGLARVAELVEQLASELAGSLERPQYAKVKRSADEGRRVSLRSYLGTIPDYLEDVQGVLLAGVHEDGPADKGGLRGGDVIVEFGGRKIANIYDYTYALEAVKIGEPLAVVVLREGERLTLSVTPEVKK